MSWWWIVAGFIAVPALYFTVASLIGTVAPRTSGKAYLVKAMKRQGLGASTLTEPCLDELTAKAMKVADMMKEVGGRPYSTALMEHLDATAATIRLYFDGHLQSDWDRDNSVVQTLKRHGIE